VSVLTAARQRELAALPGEMRMLLFACWHAGTLHEGLRPREGPYSLLSVVRSALDHL